MEDEILVSVSIITYNQKSYLKECIESILQQDYKNIEIVIADDCSTDGTQEMLYKYNEKYQNKFVLLLSDKNQGITKNSNLAHFSCKGKYVFIMGGDDLMLPNKISTQVAYMEKNSNCAICYHNLDVFNSDTDTTIKYFNNKNNSYQGDVSTSIIQGVFNGACSTVIRRDKTPGSGYDERIPIASDWLMWIETLSSGGKIHYIDKILGRYRRHNNNITLSNHNSSEQFITLAIVEAKYPNLLEYTRIKRSMMYYSLGISSVLNGDKIQGRIYFSESILYNLFNYKSYLRYIWSFTK